MIVQDIIIGIFGYLIFSFKFVVRAQLRDFLDSTDTVHDVPLATKATRFPAISLHDRPLTLKFQQDKKFVIPSFISYNSTIGVAIQQKYHDWTELLLSESKCRDFQFITIECSIAVSLSSCNIIVRWARTCPEYSRGIRFDTLSRRGTEVVGPIGLLDFLSHPRYRASKVLRNLYRLKRMAMQAVLIIHEFLGRVEEKILSTVFDELNPMPKRSNCHIGIILGDSSVFIDEQVLKYRLFYYVIRRAVHSFQSHYGFVFFCSPRTLRHVQAVPGVILDHISLYGHLVENEKTQFLQRYQRQYFDRKAQSTLFLGRDITTFTFGVDDPSRLPLLLAQKALNQGRTQKGQASFISIPFTNLGLARAYAILSKTYCEQNVNRDGICYNPCSQRGWISPCSGARYVVDSWNRFRGSFHETIGPAKFCDARRKELRISRQRHLCEKILRYNISEPFAPTRAKIKNCHLSVGTGDIQKCYQAVRRHLMNVELPFSRSVLQFEFASPRSVAHFREEPLRDLVVRGQYTKNLLLALKSSIGEKFKIIKLDRYLNGTGIPNIEYKVLLKDIEDSVENLCLLLGKKIVTQYNDCFGVLYLLELLRAFGGINTTEVTLGVADGTISGVQYLGLGLESDSWYITDLIELGPSHWRLVATLEISRKDL